MDVTSFFNKLSLIWQEMDLCRELIWSNGVQSFRIEEIDRIYAFLVGLKFDVVRRRILDQRPIPSLMEVCYEIRLKGNRTSAINISATPVIDLAAFSARSSTSGSDKNNGNSISVY